jgi:hypothetical protein
MALRIVFFLFPLVWPAHRDGGMRYFKAVAGAGLLSQRKVPPDFCCLIVPPHRAV